ncbi:MAG: futalosine hydrolase [Chitinophagales bacterium]
MNILIVVATLAEIKPFLEAFKQFKNSDFQEFTYKKNKISILITGVGMLHTCFHVYRILSKKKYDLTLNVGIAGTFNQSFEMGKVVQICSEQIGDLGAETPDNFIPIREMPFFDAHKFPYENGILYNKRQSNWKSIHNLQQASSISVNRVSGRAKTIAEQQVLFNVDIESMEGAAFFYVCLMLETCFHEIRAISNVVEVRNKNNWHIALAIEKLTLTLIEIVEEISQDIS